MVISKLKGTRWANQLRVETKKIVKDSVEYNLERRHFPNFVLYTNKKAWMTAELFQWEMERLALHLKKNHPGKRYCIIILFQKIHNFSDFRANFMPGIMGRTPST